DGSRRQTDRGARADLPAAVLLVLRELADAVPRPVPDLRQCAGDAAEDHVGLHLLLGVAGAGVLRRAPSGAGAAQPAQARLRPRPRAEPGDAVAVARLGPARCRAATGGSTLARPVPPGLGARDERRPGRY